jgi:hypothetical protein
MEARGFAAAAVVRVPARHGDRRGQDHHAGRRRAVHPTPFEGYIHRVRDVVEEVFAQPGRPVVTNQSQYRDSGRTLWRVPARAVISKSKRRQDPVFLTDITRLVR